MFLTTIKYKFPITISKFLKNFTNTDTKKITLGRWSNENTKKTNLKIDYANEDHCGVCTGIINQKSKK